MIIMVDPALEAGQLAFRSYISGYIVLSFFVSFVGCWTTLELLHRRTSRRGLYNWYLLLTSSISMGGIGIWSMHFIGNRAVVLSHGEPRAQILYSSGFTAASFFLPIIVVLGAFYFTGTSEQVNRWSIALGGTLTGLAVCGMHYVGQLGISNYQCIYDWEHILGSAIVAVFASIIALSVFFRLRAAWTNLWWKRILCAGVLAGAVSGMHWLATVGTQYRYRGLKPSQKTQLSRQETVIVVLILSLVSCAVLVTLAFIGQRQRKRFSNRAQQLVLACAFFDTSGRVMVTSEGMIPNRKITNTYVEKTFGDDGFSRTHPAFIWVFRASRNWQVLKELIPGMKANLMSNESSRRYFPGNGTVIDGSVQLDTDFSTVFKELFCVAAQDLADHIHQPLGRIGVLFDDVMATGTIPADSKTARLHRKLSAAARAGDVERADIPYLFGKGQFLFVVREVGRQDAARLQASGFRFAGVPQIAEVLSRSLQVSKEEMTSQLQGMQKYSTTENLMDQGVHVACFALRPTVRKGFDILVPTEATNQLPHISLPMESLTDKQHAIMHCMDDWTLADCLTWLKGNTTYTTTPDQNFCKEVHACLSRLAEIVEDPFIMESRFTAKKVFAPCKAGSRITVTKATLFCVRAITGIHTPAPNPKLTYRPLRLFNAQQQVYAGVTDHEYFARQIHREFANIASRKDNEMERKKADTVMSSPPQSAGASTTWTPPSPAGASTTWSPPSPAPSPAPSRHSRADSTDRPLVSNQAFGGILVSNNVTVEMTELDKSTTRSSIDLHDLRSSGDACYDGIDEDTFVDQLYSMAVSDGHNRLRRSTHEGK